MGTLVKVPIAVLLVEDDQELAEFVRKSLEEEHCMVRVAHRGGSGLRYAERHQFDIIVLDVMLPEIDGFEITRRLRLQHIRTPILLLTGRDAPQDVVRGLDAGADDYLTKPFTMGELLARLRAAFRRGFGSATIEVFKAGDLKLDFNRREVFVGDDQVKLTATEYDLLKVLVRHAGLVRTHHQLIHELWGTTQYQDAVHLLRVTVSNLRRKLVCDPRFLRYIVTEPGVGYRLRTDSEWIGAGAGH